MILAIRIFGVSGVPVLCAVACFHTRPDTQHEACACSSRDLEIGLSKGTNVRTRKMVRSVRRA